MKAIARVGLVATTVRRWPWPEIAQAGLLITGWGALTWALASLIGRREVYAIAGAVLALTLFGWRFLYVLGRDGVYALTQQERKK